MRRTSSRKSKDNIAASATLFKHPNHNQKLKESSFWVFKLTGIWTHTATIRTRKSRPAGYFRLRCRFTIREKAREGISAQTHAHSFHDVVSSQLLLFVVCCCCVWTGLLLCVDSLNDAFVVVCCWCDSLWAAWASPPLNASLSKLTFEAEAASTTFMIGRIDAAVEDGHTRFCKYNNVKSNKRPSGRLYEE